MEDFGNISTNVLHRFSIKQYFCSGFLSSDVILTRLLPTTEVRCKFFTPMNLIKLLTGRKTKRPRYAVEGWVARDGRHRGALEDDLHFFYEKPSRLERVGSDLEIWNAYGPRFTLPQGCFPKLRYRHEPIKIRLELWKI